MTIAVHGIGWLTKEGYGCIRSELRHDYEIGEGTHTLPRKDIFSHPFKNFGRLDTLSKMTAFGVSLALQDAGIEYTPIRKQNIGIVGTNAEGSLRSDIEYFKDYLEGGRTLSRGNLFIYTLPSSPLGEAAIHFGLMGPVLYAVRESGPLAAVLDLASEMLLADEAPVMLAGKAEADEAMFFVLGRGPRDAQTALCDVTEARAFVEAETGPGVAGLVLKLSQVAARKA
jgi:3-oxoacyl-[acyl-carrier-protein] synthase II